jgi:hypothetical protein
MALCRTFNIAGRYLGLLIYPLLLAACALGPAPGTRAAAPPGPNPPLFEDSFALSSIWDGQMWEIFVAGSDPDGDMKHIWVVVSQSGGNMWSNHFVPLTGENRGHFSGYLALYTPRLRQGLERVRVDMKIRDAAGHYSNERSQEVLIGAPPSEGIPEKWRLAAQNRLGVIFFEFDLRQAEGDRSSHER